jgi:hypothetical protein
MNPTLIAGALALVIGFGGGWAVNGWRLNGEIADMKLTAETQAETLRLAGQRKINTIETKYVVRAEKQAKVDRTISDKVEQNVPSTLPLLPGSFRVQHDAAATGQEVDDSRAADAAPVAPRTVAGTITRNYESARSDKERLEEMQAIVRASGCFEFEGE